MYDNLLSRLRGEAEASAEHEDCGLFKPKQKQTNADRIRAMTDEELVDEYFYILHKVFPEQALIAVKRRTEHEQKTD